MYPLQRRILCMLILTPLALLPSASYAQSQQGPVHLTGQILAGKRALEAKNFVEARRIFSAEVKRHPNSIQAMLGLADSELALNEYLAAEAEYRLIVDKQPELWQAHKNLVVVEAALGRWGEFDRERTVLRMARERNAPGITARESDIIDGFDVDGKHWIVREYYEPEGRTQSVYNFEYFSPAHHDIEYISLDSAALSGSVAPGSVAIGDQPPAAPAPTSYRLTWLNGRGHGTIKIYGSHEPTYEQVRADVMEWLRSRKESAIAPHPSPQNN
jgi:tetratricopeptide (TPR) repeat protein